MNKYLTFLLLLSNMTFGQSLQASFVCDHSAINPYIISCSYYFRDQSTGNPISWYWDFENGHTSTDQNPICGIMWLDTLHVMLVVTDSTGNTDTAFSTLINTGECVCNDLIGINEIAGQAEVLVSPVVSNGHLSLSVHSKRNYQPPFQLLIFNTLGSLKGKINIPSIDYNMYLNLNSGIYFFQLESVSSGVLGSGRFMIVDDR